ncbi:uncharacterized protein MELLADRAFT_109089 [Melampsora larici-populina 98AG31]|uniref:Uncharacterized protein n=1 Tax=Melampsora larici-populina (strain 98AG31 / pathotype 3-4-7) TaxID=747676 RepID=F4RVA2_MELLP|nr:uncharacterized protein MELLADRAFT_109089 [Melampsora larici-populina 98AG31]EGG03703.1 hypothetical protein MELLADRAFT_109089 [Melampsora larici-populina 98AG31]
MVSSRPLPVEVVENIISFLCIIYPSTTTEPSNGADQSFLIHSSIVHLLQLRLLARSWAAAIPRFVYSSLCLRTPNFNRYLVNMWINCLNISNLTNLRRLCLNQVLFIPASKATGYHMALSDELSLTVDTIPNDLPRRLSIHALLKLRIVRCKHIDPSRDLPIWFEWSLFHTIEVLIINYCGSRSHWERVLLIRGGPHLKEAKKLKHFIFITGSGDPIEDRSYEALNEAKRRK